MEAEQDGQENLNEQDLKKESAEEPVEGKEQENTSTPEEEKNTAESSRSEDNSEAKEEGNTTPEQESKEKNEDREPESDAREEGDHDHHEEYDFHEDDLHHEEEINYEELNKEELLEKIKQYSSQPIESIRDKVVNEIHRYFYRIVDQDKEEARKKFVGEGGEESDFEFRADNEVISHFEDYYRSFKEKRRHFLGDLEKRKEANVKLKEELLERLRKMVDGDVDSYSVKVLREIEEEWRKAEPVLPARARELWANFNALRDRFYDQRSLLYEMKDLDRKKNQALKEEIIEKAEQLLSKDSMLNAVAELKKLHEEYKHIGPVPQEVRTRLWERFKEISDKIHDKRREVSEEFKKVLEDNLARKEDLIKKILELQGFASDRINEWNDKTKEVLKMQEEWKKIGPTPKSSARDISKQFWSHFKGFFKHKQNFFKEIDKKRNENLETKIMLCEEVERIKDSEDWESTAQRIKEIQKEWKEVGPVPRKKSEQVYQRFKGLCDEFFNRRRELLGEKNKEFKQNLLKKNEICDKIEALGELTEKNLVQAEDLVHEWSDIGFVEHREIKSSRARLKDSLLKLLDKKDRESKEYEELSFRIEALIGNATGRGGSRGLEVKIEKFKKQIGQIQREAENWKQNVEMFAKTDSASKIRKEVEEKIQAAEDKVKSLREKIKILRG